MKVASAEFVGAASVPGRFPPPGAPEVAFAGRSNVGKSSAINRLLGRRGLARTSGTPGRTQQVNFFAVGLGAGRGGADRGRPATLVFVDLPGYGYARVSHAVREAWRPLVESYLGGRDVLAGVVLLVDARRGIEDEETALLAFLAGRGIPVAIVVTKVDKLGRREREAALAALAADAGTGSAGGGVGAAPVVIVPFSSVTGEGADAVWRAIAGWTAERALPARSAARGMRPPRGG